MVKKMENMADVSFTNLIDQTTHGNSAPPRHSLLFQKLFRTYYVADIVLGTGMILNMN